MRSSGRLALGKNPAFDVKSLSTIALLLAPPAPGATMGFMWVRGPTGNGNLLPLAVEVLADAHTLHLRAAGNL
jgi:hypothetical protein